MGLKVIITELEIDMLPLTKEGQIIGGSISEKKFLNEDLKTFLDPYAAGLLAEVATQLTNRYKELFEIFYAKKDKIDRIPIWGLSDEMSC